jgi:hypothetical protein
MSEYLSQAAAAGGYVQLWAEAAEWSFTERVMPKWIKDSEERSSKSGSKLKLVEHRNPRDDFRQWWVRAAYAMGHSRWLEKEILVLTGKIS